MDNETQALASNPIVVGIDGSVSSILALRRAAELATALNTQLHAVTAWDFVPLFGGYVPDEWSPEADARDVLADAVRTVFGEQTPPGFQSRIEQGSPAAVLIKESESAGMIVIGSRGHGGFAGLLLGSVSARCAEYAKCSVLVVHGAVVDEQAEVDTLVAERESVAQHRG